MKSQANCGQKQTIGVFEAKARLSELLRQVEEEGKSFMITNRGVAVAELVPSGGDKKQKAREAITAIRAMRRELAPSWPVLTAEEIKAMIEEGRA